MDVRSLLASHGLRATRQREQVYGALMATKAHPTAEELFQSLPSSADGEPPLSLATVYNTLEALNHAGLCRRFACDRGSGAWRYDADTTPHVHLNLPDGNIRDLPPDLSDRVMSHLPPTLIEEVESRLGVKVAGIGVQVVAAPAAAPEPDTPR